MFCIVQARCGSRRLNRKIFKKIKNEMIIERVINQLKKSKKITNIIVATSKYKQDDDIEKFCLLQKIIIYRGSLNNVASRFLEISKIYNLKKFIRVSCDSPFLDHKLIDCGIDLSKKSNFDLITNVFPRTFPKGLSFEIIKKSIMEKCLHKFSHHDKEHVTSFFYKNYNQFKIYNFFASQNFSKINLCVDTDYDLKYLRSNYSKIINQNFS